MNTVEALIERLTGVVEEQQRQIGILSETAKVLGDAVRITNARIDMILGKEETKQ